MKIKKITLCIISLFVTISNYSMMQNILEEQEKSKTLHDLCQYPDKKTLESFLEENKRILNERNSFGWTPLYTACVHNNRQAVEVLLNIPGIAVNDQGNDCGNTALHMVVMRENAALVCLLLAHHIDQSLKNFDGKTPLELARMYRNQNIINILEDQTTKKISS